MKIFIIFIAVMCFPLLVARKATSLRNAELEREARKKYLADLETLYEAIREKAWQNRKYRHDLEKHIRTVETMLEQKEHTDMRQYSDALKESYELVKMPRFCSDEIVNAILVIKNRQCKERKIDFQIQVMDTEYAAIREIDLIGLLDNLLDNAVEAQEKIPEAKRFIRIEMQKQDGISLVVENRIPDGERISFRTTKANPKLHGIGMKIMDEIIASYHGTKENSIDEENHLLSIRVHLNTAEDARGL